MTNTVKKEVATPVKAVVELEIMPVDAVQDADYEQTGVKPPRIQQIEQYIAKRKDVLNQMQERIERLEKQRPDLAFKNYADALNSLEKKLNQIIEDQQITLNQVEGAEAELKREVEKWINGATKKRQKDKKELENELESIERKVKEHLDAISEIQGTKALLLPSAYRSDRIKEQLKFGYYNDFKDIAETIYKKMGMKN